FMPSERTLVAGRIVPAQSDPTGARAAFISAHAPVRDRTSGSARFHGERLGAHGDGTLIDEFEDQPASVEPLPEHFRRCELPAHGTRGVTEHDVGFEQHLQTGLSDELGERDCGAARFDADFTYADDGRLPGGARWRHAERHHGQNRSDAKTHGHPIPSKGYQLVFLYCEEDERWDEFR